MKKTHKGEGMTDSGIEGQIKLAFKVNGLKTNNLLYKDILTIVRQAEATHTKQLQALLDEMPTYDKDLDDVGGMYPIPVQMFGTKLDEWKKRVEKEMLKP